MKNNTLNLFTKSNYNETYNYKNNVWKTDDDKYNKYIYKLNTYETETYIIFRYYENNYTSTEIMSSSML